MTNSIETTLPTVTAKESAMLKAIRDNEYTQGERLGGVWAFIICEDRSGSAVFGSLVKKGLASSYVDGGEKWCSMTELGAEVLDDLLMMETPVVAPAKFTDAELDELDAVDDAPAVATFAAFLNLVLAAGMHQEGDTYSPLSEDRRECNRDARRYLARYEVALEAVDAALEAAVAMVFETLFSENGTFIEAEGEVVDAPVAEGPAKIAAVFAAVDKVLEAPLDISAAAREGDFAPVLVEEADAALVHLVEDDAYAAAYVAAQSRKNAGPDARAEENRKGLNGREAQAWQVEKDRKVAVESCGCGSPFCYVVGEDLGSMASESAPGLDLCRDCGLPHAGPSDDEPSDEPSELMRADEELEAALVALEDAEARVEAARAAYKAARLADMEDDSCSDCDGSGFFWARACGTPDCSCDGFSGGCTVAERCPCEDVRCRVDEDTGEGGDDCPCSECIGNRLDSMGGL